jgi:hypothetical protein
MNPGHPHRRSGDLGGDGPAGRSGLLHQGQVAIEILTEAFADGVRLLGHPPPPGSAAHWLDWRRHQACSRWYHQRTRLARYVEIALVR